MTTTADKKAATDDESSQQRRQEAGPPAQSGLRSVEDNDGGRAKDQDVAFGLQEADATRCESVPAVDMSKNPKPHSHAQLDLPQAPALYSLLECVGCTRTEVHAACLAAVKTRLLSLVAKPNADRNRLRHLARKALEYVDVPELRDITLALVTEHREVIGDETWDRLIGDQRLLSDAPVAARQAIWLRDPTLLPSSLSPLLDAYTADENLHAASLEMVWQRGGDAGVQPDTWSPGGGAALEGVTTVGIVGRDIVSLARMRRSHPIFRQIVEAFGQKEELYEQIRPLCRTGFRNACKSSGTHVYPEMIGTLASDLIMTFHQEHFEHLSGHTNEEIHTLIWNMDACKGGGQLDTSRINELNLKCFDHLQTNSSTYIDAAIVLVDPYTQNMFASTILHCLEELAPHTLSAPDPLREDQEKLVEIVKWSTNLAEFGQRARKMAGGLSYEIPYVFDSSFRQFYFVGMARMIQLDLEQERKSPEKRSAGKAAAEEEGSLGKEHYNLMIEYDIALRVYVHYVLSRVAKAHAVGVRRALGPLLEPHGLLFSSNYLSSAAWQSLVSILLTPFPLRRLLSAEDPTFRRACVDDGLVVAAADSEFANLQLARLALEVVNSTENLWPENSETLDEVDIDRQVEKLRQTAANSARAWASSVTQHETKWTGRKHAYDSTIRKLLAGYLVRVAANAFPSAFTASSSTERRQAAMYSHHREVAVYLFGERQQQHQALSLVTSGLKRGRPDDGGAAAGGEIDERGSKCVDTGKMKGGTKEKGGELMWLD